MLEVSSPGIERPLKTDEDIENNINEYVHIDFLNHFAVTAKTKVLELEGYLRNYSNNVLEIEYNNRGQIKKLSINKEEIRGYLKYLDELKYSKTTISRILSTLRHFYQYLMIQKSLQQKNVIQFLM